MVRASVWGAVASVLLLSQPASAETVNTAGETGAYHSHFCPALVGAMARYNYKFTCSPSNGTEDNMARVARNPRSFGYGQLDVLALSGNRLGGHSALAHVRADDVRECIFAVTKRADLTNFGEVAVFAGQLNFFTPPESSGSHSTFRFLQKIDPEGLGQATRVDARETTDAAIRAALDDPSGVAFFVQFPDPQNTRFRLIQDLGGHIIPVIDRAILAQTVDGRKIYYAQETQVTNSRWLAAGETVVTACTPLVLFTGAPERITDATERRNHLDLIATVRDLRPNDVLPTEPLITRFLKRTKQLSAQGAERLSQLAQEARERAKPLVEKAKEGARIMIEKAKPQSGQTQ